MLRGMSNKPATRETLLAKEGLASLLALALLALAAAFYPLDPVGSGVQSGQAKAPWLFLGLQELLRHLPAIAAGVLIPLAAFLLYAALPWLSKQDAVLRPRWQRRWLLAEYLAWLTLAAWAGLTVYAAVFR